MKPMVQKAMNMVAMNNKRKISDVFYQTLNIVFSNLRKYRPSQPIYDKTVSRYLLSITDTFLTASNPTENPPQENKKSQFSKRKRQNPIQSQERKLKRFKKIVLELFELSKRQFISYYSSKKHLKTLIFNFSESIDYVESETITTNTLEHVVNTWLPENNLDLYEIQERWKLKDVIPNPEPYKQTEIVIQLNALYTLPVNEPESYQYKNTIHFDHPVRLYDDENHELIKCLTELNGDIVFEKKIGVFPVDYRVPICVSISVTHSSIFKAASEWVKNSLSSLRIEHIRLILLDQLAVERINRFLGINRNPVFSVYGNYSAHFNALKYFQLLLEKPFGIRAGFKLDTDEGLHSEELYSVTGKTWFQTLCSPYWGGTAKNYKGQDIYLGLIIGDYVTEVDYKSLGYAKSRRRPDVKHTKIHLDSDLFFCKDLVHSKHTAFYRKAIYSIDDCMFVPLLKGGAHGIDNHALRNAAPFVPSVINRGEDQFLLAECLNKGIYGLYNPDLNVIHYKKSVAVTEADYTFTRYVEDMRRLLLCNIFGKNYSFKEQLNPMPGLFFGQLGIPQAFFSILYKSLLLFEAKQYDNAIYVFEKGVDTIYMTMIKSQNGLYNRMYQSEQTLWHGLVDRINHLTQKQLDLLFTSISLAY